MLDARYESMSLNSLSPSIDTLTVAILVESKRKKIAILYRQHPGALIVDVTSKGPMPWMKFSPFYPHGGIPVPFSPGYVSESVEGIWQGLKKNNVITKN